ncbi:uncharacterized protein LOC142232845 [Haematobia irritans]|uniref:uncharacterized protein LOC142232845 n=1 Tax=Haematobia irritans TaxID=7368 RepID=UPI003F4F407C
MIKLLEHVPIKIEKDTGETIPANKKNTDEEDEEEQIKDDDDIDSEDNDDEDEEIDEEDEDEEECDSEVMDVEQEVTMLMSSDEEAELEAQRIRFPEKRLSRKKSQDSKSSRTTSRNSNSSQTSTNNSNATLEASLNNTLTKASNENHTVKIKEITKSESVEVAKPKQQQRSSQRNNTRKENSSLPPTSGGNSDLRQVVACRRQSNNSTCSLGSSIASTESAETESCGNIYVFQSQQKLIFSCEFCDLKYGNLENLSRHLHENHHLFQMQDEDQEKENSPRNLRNKNKANRMPAKTLQQQALSVVKKEPLQTTAAESTLPPVALSLDTQTEHSLQSCGNVFILNHRKLFLICGHCETKYANVELFEKHLRQQHDVFEGTTACNEVNVIPKTEIKQEVYIITEMMEKSAAILPTNEAAMVTIPAEIPLDISTTEIDVEDEEENAPNTIANEKPTLPRETPLESGQAIESIGAKEISAENMGTVSTKISQKSEARPKSTVPTEIPLENVASSELIVPTKIPLENENISKVVAPTEITLESEMISSIQIHDSGVTIAEIPVIIASEDTSTIVMAESSTTTISSESVEAEIIDAAKDKSAPLPPTDKQQRKRHSSPEKLEDQKSPQKRPRRTVRKILELPEETEDNEKPQSKTKSTKKERGKAKKDSRITTEKQRKSNSTATETGHQPASIQNENPVEPTKLNTTAPKRKRKPPLAKTKIEKPDSATLSQTQFVLTESSASGPTDKDEEFLEDPVAEIIEQIQNEMNNGAQEVRIQNVCSIPTSLSKLFGDTSPQIMASSTSSLSPDKKTQVLDSDPNSPEDIKPIINHLGERRFVCDQCPRSFRKNVRLVEHKRLHTGEKPFVCDECGKRFRIRMQLNEHKLRHSKEKKFICEVCQLGCCTKQDLNLHMRHHTNDRRFHCTMCPKAFVRNSDLKIHVRVHTGEKPYVCDICHKCFRANQNLSVHKKSHMGEASKTYQCEHCDKKFLRNIDRTVHMRSHTGEKPFKCEICDRAYSSKFNVRAHIERDHIMEHGKKKPGPKPRALREELAKQKKLIEELQQQLLRQIKTDETIIPAEEHSNHESDMEDVDNNHTIMDHHIQGSNISPTNNAANEQNESFIISEINSPTSMSLTAAIPQTPPSQSISDNPFTKAARQKPSSSTTTTTVVPLTITPKTTTTQVVSQNTSLGIQQVMSVTVSMQVENVPTSTSTTANVPEKENAGISNLQMTTTSPSPTSNANNVKKERKITSYFTVIGQKAEG